MDKENERYSSTRVDISSLLNREGKKLDLDNLLDPAATTRHGREKEVRHISPGEYVVIVSMVLASLWLLVSSFFPLVSNVVTSFEPINFLMNLFYFTLGLGVLAGAFLIFKKETHLEHIADDTFDEVIYKRLEPVLHDVAEVHVGLGDVNDKLEMMNLNIEKMGKARETAAPAETVAMAQLPVQASMYVKYIILINITLAVFLFMLQYPLEYIPYAVTIIFIIWWVVITAEFKLWDVESVWVWVFVPILILPVYTIIMSAYLRDYQMFGSLFIGLGIYVILYYSWCTNLVSGVLPLDLHIVLAQFKEKLSEKIQGEETKAQKMPAFNLKTQVAFDLRKLATPLLIGSVALFAVAWFGFSIQHGYIPNITWEVLGMEKFTWKPLYSYALTAAGIVLLGAGLGLTFKFRGRND
ncbi:MAG: hypothetical protein OIN66_09195 [Candidatus Methanoperedens sp.]|nr:hypothetical protein [Candidatus Methanoperedens sp.]